MLVRNDWNKDVKKALNEFLIQYRDQNQYVVFDFDNTCSIFDSAEHVAFYQLKTLSFALNIEEMEKMLWSSLIKDQEYLDYIEDIITAYTSLYNRFGPFSYMGVKPELYSQLMDDSMWKELYVKIFHLYRLIEKKEGTTKAYCWICFWFTNMTKEEVYDLSCRALHYYKDLPTRQFSCCTDPLVLSKTGVKELIHLEGISITENIIELWKSLKEAEIGVYVCSASHIEVVKAAIDVWNLRKYCDGLLGMSVKYTDHFENEYDLSIGYSYKVKNNIWVNNKEPMQAICQGEGKVEAIDHILVKKYGYGPAAAFMDSTGDLHFCSEYSSLKLVVCFNRADRSIYDGGGLIALVAVYQKEKGYNKQDTHYYLQGRNENNRTFIPYEASYRFNSTALQLYKNEENEKLLTLILKENKTIKEIIDDHVRKYIDPDYRGYHQKEEV